MKTAISISDQLFERAEKAAKRRGLSRSQLYARALEKDLDEEEGAKVTARINRFLDKNPGYDTLDPVMEALSLEAMRRAPWKGPAPKKGKRR